PPLACGRNIYAGNQMSPEAFARTCEVLTSQGALLPFAALTPELRALAPDGAAEALLNDKHVRLFVPTDGILPAEAVLWAAEDQAMVSCVLDVGGERLCIYPLNLLRHPQIRDVLIFEEKNRAKGFEVAADGEALAALVLATPLSGAAPLPPVVASVAVSILRQRQAKMTYALQRQNAYADPLACLARDMEQWVKRHQADFPLVEIEGSKEKWRIIPVVSAVLYTDVRHWQAEDRERLFRIGWQEAQALTNGDLEVPVDIAVLHRTASGKTLDGKKLFEGFLDVIWNHHRPRVRLLLKKSTAQLLLSADDLYGAIENFYLAEVRDGLDAREAVAVEKPEFDVYNIRFEDGVAVPVGNNRFMTLNRRVIKVGTDDAVVWFYSLATGEGDQAEIMIAPTRLPRKELNRPELLYTASGALAGQIVSISDDGIVFQAPSSLPGRGKGQTEIDESSKTAKPLAPGSTASGTLCLLVLLSLVPFVSFGGQGAGDSVDVAGPAFFENAKNIAELTTGLIALMFSVVAGGIIKWISSLFNASIESEPGVPSRSLVISVIRNLGTDTWIALISGIIFALAGFHVLVSGSVFGGYVLVRLVWVIFRERAYMNEANAPLPRWSAAEEMAVDVSIRDQAEKEREAILMRESIIKEEAKEAKERRRQTREAGDTKKIVPVDFGGRAKPAVRVRPRPSMADHRLALQAALAKNCFWIKMQATDRGALADDLLTKILALPLVKESDNYCVDKDGEHVCIVAVKRFGGRVVSTGVNAGFLIENVPAFNDDDYVLTQDGQESFLTGYRLGHMLDVNREVPRSVYASLRHPQPRHITEISDPWHMLVAGDTSDASVKTNMPFPVMARAGSLCVDPQRSSVIIMADPGSDITEVQMVTDADPFAEISQLDADVRASLSGCLCLAVREAVLSAPGLFMAGISWSPRIVEENPETAAAFFDGISRVDQIKALDPSVVADILQGQFGSFIIEIHSEAGAVADVVMPRDDGQLPVLRIHAETVRRFTQDNKIGSLLYFALVQAFLIMAYPQDPQEVDRQIRIILELHRPEADCALSAVKASSGALTLARQDRGYFPVRPLNSPADLAKTQKISFVDRKALTVGAAEKRTLSILLIQPRISGARYTPHRQSLGLFYIASFMKQHGYDVRIIDLDPGDVSFDFLSYLKSVRPSVVGMTAVTRLLPEVNEIARLTRLALPDALLVLGGPHASAMPRWSLENVPVDVVIPGEGEEVLLGLVKEIETPQPDLSRVNGLFWRTKDGRVMENAPHTVKLTLDEMPFASDTFDLLANRIDFSGDEGEHYLPVITARGCPFRCAYCTVNNAVSTMRIRTAENVVDELEKLAGRGNRNFFFWDDTFTLDRRRAVRIAELIMARKLDISWAMLTRADCLDMDLLVLLKKAGLRRMAIGVESADPVILREVDKKLDLGRVVAATAMAKELGIAVKHFYMVGIPGQTWRSIEQTAQFMAQTKPNDIEVGILMPYPGTKYYNDPRIVFRDHARDDFSCYIDILRKSETEIENIDCPYDTDAMTAADIKEARKLLVNVHRQQRSPLALRVVMDDIRRRGDLILHDIARTRPGHRTPDLNEVTVTINRQALEAPLKDVDRSVSQELIDLLKSQGLIADAERLQRIHDAHQLKRVPVKGVLRDIYGTWYRQRNGREWIYITEDIARPDHPELRLTILHETHALGGTPHAANEAFARQVTSSLPGRGKGQKAIDDSSKHLVLEMVQREESALWQLLGRSLAENAETVLQERYRSWEELRGPPGAATTPALLGQWIDIRQALKNGDIARAMAQAAKPEAALSKTKRTTLKDLFKDAAILLAEAAEQQLGAGNKAGA
ncbi:MAG: B12-binding domain-containing radical SAM protein, partial [Candidatus Omnitrophica bacterium]|nr:B12-binding domain-containing radical SAM protein [Candidatus Omnitrophota bacterium]